MQALSSHVGVILLCSSTLRYGCEIFNRIIYLQNFIVMKKNENNCESVNIVTALTELRKKLRPFEDKCYTFSQALKACQGIKCAEECEALGIANFSYKSVVSAWAEELYFVNEEGERVRGLYLNVPVTIEQGADEDGEPILKNAYERTETKKGGVKFKALKKRVLGIPKRWTPSLIIEMLAQSREIELAIEEAIVSEMHAANVLRKGAYIKVTTDMGEGVQQVSYEPAMASEESEVA